MTTRISSALHLQSSYMRFFSAVLIVSEQTPQDPIHCRSVLDVGRGIVKESTLDEKSLKGQHPAGEKYIYCGVTTKLQVNKSSKTGPISVV